MYIIELFFKLKNKFSHKTSAETSAGSTDREEENPDLIDEALNCKHIFVPIDSTKEVLACSKCGLVVHAKDIKKKKDDDNFFVK